MAFQASAIEVLRLGLVPVVPLLDGRRDGGDIGHAVVPTVARFARKRWKILTGHSAPSPRCDDLILNRTGNFGSDDIQRAGDLIILTSSLR